MGNYNLTNRVGGQIREKIDLGLSRIDLAALGQFGKPRSIFCRIDPGFFFLYEFSLLGNNIQPGMEIKFIHNQVLLEIYNNGTIIK